MSIASPTLAPADDPITIDRVVEIERLASLESLDYETIRTEAAAELGVRASWLDQAVKKKRRALGLESSSDDPGQGRAVKIEDILPWHEPIEGDRVATGLAAAIKTYVVLPDISADAISLWVLQTWLLNKFTISPRLAIKSPTKGCGKTTVLRFLGHVVRRPKRAGSISPAALFRVVEQFQPTVLLDETEKYIEHGSDLHALLNEGHARGATILRVLGDNNELREFSIFGAVAFARNGRLPDDLEQRSIVIEMQRRRADEELTELRDDRCDRLRDLAKMCARWADDNADEVAGIDPDMGDLINRNADNWRPLFAIADVIGSDWPARIRDAAAMLAPREVSSIGPMLLADIKAVFDGKKTDPDRIWSEDLAVALAGMEGRPWAEFGKTQKPLTKNRLAGLLGDFEVTPVTVWIDKDSKKGYHRHQFQEAFERYLGAHRVNETSERQNTDETGTSATFQNDKAKTDLTFQKCQKPASNGHSDDLTFQKPENAPSHATIDAQICGHCCKGGAELEAHYGDASAWLHRECQDAWRAAQDDDLSIPTFLRREAVA